MTTPIPPLDDAMLALLQPLSPEQPCGPAMRYDPVFTEIRLAREEDDPDLPMRQWERPLKKADWPLIERLCTDTLSGRTKDLQLAAWLLEAWTRQRGFAGLARGLQLVHELQARFWEPLHPVIDEGYSDARVAPLAWINESLPLTLKVHVVFLTLVERKPSRVSFADWERMTATELAGESEPKGKSATHDADPPLTRQEVFENLRRQGGEFVTAQLADVREALGQLAALDRALDAWLGQDAPNLGKLKTTLAAIERVLVGLQAPARAVAPSAAASVAAASANSPPGLQHPQELGADTDQPAPDHSAPVPRGDWRSREDAYRTLEALADYLGRVEPHSPTPYLIRRAVKWGRMPLPELMTEIVREEGDLNRLANLIGVNPQG